MPTEYERRERELAEIDMQMGDFLIPSIDYPYQQRLQEASNYLDKVMTYTTPEDKAVRRGILNKAELRQGTTNFWANPELYGPATGLQITGRGWSTDIPKESQKADAGVLFNNPYRVYVNPSLEYETKDYPSGNLLGHEITHTKQGINWLRGQQNPVKHIPVNPDFSEAFLSDLKRLKKTKYDRPYYSGWGFGSDPEETIAYMMGREAQLPKGKTLRDDPVFRVLFDRNPGMWDIYQTSRNRLRNIK